MKKLLLASMAFAMTSIAIAQSADLDQFFHKYEGKEGFTSINVSEKLFSLCASAMTSDPEMQSIVDGFKSVKVLVYENVEGAPRSGEFYKEASEAFPKGQFEELMTVNSEGEKVVMLGKLASEKVIDELLFLCDADNEFVLVNIVGKIDIEKISKLSEMNIEGLDELKKAEKE